MPPPSNTGNNDGISSQIALMLELRRSTDSVAESMRTVVSTQREQLQVLQDMLRVMQQITSSNPFSAISESATNAANNTRNFTNSLRDNINLRNNLNDITTRSNRANISDQQRINSLTQENNQNNQRVVGILDALKDKWGGVAGKAKEYFENLNNQSTGLLVVKGLGEGFSNFFNVLQGGFSILSTIAGVIAKLGMALVMLPLNILGKFIEMAGNAAGSNELAMALEKIRKQFGDLNGPTATSIKTTANNMKGFAQTGLSAFSVFGNKAERLEYVNQLATEMGQSFRQLEEDFKDNEGAALAYQKGLGLTSEDMRTVVLNAKAMGQSSETVLRDMTKYAFGLAEAFGEDGKVLSRDVAQGLKDVKHFANSTVKQIAQAALYARKLGLELDKIMGVMDAFDTFEDAADNVSALNQNLGIQLDTFKMMEASTPDEKLNLLRQGMRDAGVSAQNLDRFQLRLLASSAGLDEETAKAALSLENQGLSLEEIKKKGSGLDKKTMTQQEAMIALKDSIDKMIKPAEKMMGFLEQFMKGIEIGIQQIPAFKEAIMAVRNALWATFQNGVRIGRMFENFPGLVKTLKAITAIFDPTRFQNFFDKVQGSFKKFFSDLQGDGPNSFGNFLDNITKNFLEWFDASTPAGKQYLEGLKEFFMTFVKIVGQGLKWVIDKLTVGFKWVTAYLKDPKKAGLNIKKGEDLISKILKEFMPAWNALIDEFLPALGEMFVQLLKTLWQDYVKPAFIKFWYSTDETTSEVRQILLTYLGVTLLGPAFVNLAGSIVAKTFAGIFTRALTSSVVSSAIAQGGTSSASALAPLTSTLANPYVAIIAVAAAAVAGGMYAASKTFMSESEKLEAQHKDFIYEQAKRDKNISSAELIKMMQQRQLEEQKNVEDEWTITKKFRTLGKGGGLGAAVAGGALGWGATAAAAGSAVPVAGTAVGAGIGAAAGAVWGLGSALVLAKETENEATIKAREKVASIGKDIEEMQKKLAEEQLAETPGTEQYIKKQAELNRQALLASLGFGEGQIINPEEVNKKIDEINKLRDKILSKDFGLAEAIKQIKDKLSEIDWDIIGDKRDSFVKAVADIAQVKFFIVSLYEIATNGIEVGKKIKDLEQPLDYVGAYIGKFQEVQQHVTQQMDSFIKGNEAFSAGMTSVIEQARVANEIVSRIKDPLTSLTENLNNLAPAAQSFDSFMVFFDKAKGMSTKLTDDYVGSVVSAFNKMVELVNKTDAILAGGMKVDLPARLQTVANGLGLAERVKTTVKQGDIVINIDMNVTMDTMSVESAILKKPESQIRMRLNKALDPDSGTRGRTVDRTQLLPPVNFNTLKNPADVPEKPVQLKDNFNGFPIETAYENQASMTGVDSTTSIPVMPYQQQL